MLGIHFDIGGGLLGHHHGVCHTGQRPESLDQHRVLQRGGRERQANAGHIRRFAHGNSNRQPEGSEHRASDEHHAQPAVLEHPAAEDAAQRRAEELAGGIHPHRRALAAGRRDLADQRRQRGFEQVEGSEEHHRADHQHGQAVTEDQEEQFAGQQGRHRAGQHALHATLLLGVDDERHHAEETDQQRGQVDPPVLLLGQAPLVHQCQRQGDEAGHEDGVEDQDAGVQAQQVAVLQGRQQGLARHAGFAVLGHVVRLRDEEQDQQQADQRHPGGEPEQPMQAEQMGQHRAEHHGHGEGDADAHADHRHRLGPVLLAGEVGEQRHHRRRDRPGALQDAAGDHPPDGVGIGREGRAGGEDQQPDDDHRAPADAVGNGPEGNLQDRLGQAIGADGQADQRRGRAGQVLAVGGQHRQDHEHAEHAEGEYQ